MSQSTASRQAQSGLKAIKRDWSEAAPLLDSSSLPENLPSSGPRQQTNKLPPVAEQRPEDIQDNITDRPVLTPSNASARSTNKRPSPIAILDSRNTKRPNVSGPDNTFKVAPKDSILHTSTKWRSSSSLSTSTGPQPVEAKAPSSTPTTTTKAPVKATAKPAALFLSQEQQQIKKLVEDGSSVFYTGSAGTGKSVLLREIIKSLRKKYVKSPDAVAITASTGIAACNIGGVTIHSFAGIGLGIETAEVLADKVKKNRKASTRWLRTKVLIIDEVSMMDADLFDKLSRIGSILRKKVDPFGGIQLVITGDFFQLPPVTKSGTQVKFAFEAAIWKEAIKRTFNLTKVFRQSDQEFIDMLNQMRFGRLSQDSVRKFSNLKRPIDVSDGIQPTELFPRREDVERSNTLRMRALATQEITFTSKDGGTIQDPQQRDRLLANFMAPARLAIRIDAQVMLIKNTDDTLVNGSLGRVVGFSDTDTFGAEPDQPGSGSGSKKVIPRAGIELYPVVEFAIGKSSTRKVLVQPETWKVELPNGEVQASRTQLPLILSWAMSIHKSQGQTLDRVKVDLAKVFEKGQAYVALSRATSLAGLQVLNFDASKVRVHPKVVEWSKTLETVSEK